MFMVPIDSPGITLRRIKQVNGSVEFCEEFFDNLELGDDAVVGEVNEGWHVASRQLYHERRAVGGGSEFASGVGAEGKTDMPIDYVALLEKTGQADNERAREMAGRALVHRAVREQLIDHVITVSSTARYRRRRARSFGSRTPRSTIWSSTPYCRSPGVREWSTVTTT